MIEATVMVQPPKDSGRTTRMIEAVKFLAVPNRGDQIQEGYHTFRITQVTHQIPFPRIVVYADEE